MGSATLRSWRSRTLAAVARLPASRFPIKGWTQVTDRLHPYIIDGPADVIYRTAYGVSMHLDLQDYVQRSIFYDAWEMDELNLVRHLLRQGDVMLDVGANVGIFALVAALGVFPGGEVHAFEPIPANCDRLRRNLKLNDVSNVCVNEMAVGAGKGVITLGLDSEMERTSGRETSGFFTAGQPHRSVQAPVVDLDSYLEEHIQNRPVRLLKMDIEGQEPRALAGLRRTLANHRAQVILLEVGLYSLARQGARIAEVVEPLERAGYRLYRLGMAGTLWRWRYRGEPTVPVRAPGRVGLFRGVWRGIADLGRHFNLVAVTSETPTVTSDPAVLRTAGLADRNHSLRSRSR